jgi:hypothetical protein
VFSTNSKGAPSRPPNSFARLRLIHRPAIGECDLFQIRIGVDGEWVRGQGEHFAVPDGVAEGAIGPGIRRRIEHGFDRLHLARSAGNSNQPAGDYAIVDFYFGGQDAIGMPKNFIAERMIHWFEEETAHTSHPEARRRSTRACISGKMFGAMAFAK